MFGINSPEIDAELILMSARLWRELGVADKVRLELNNLGDEETRNSFSKALVEFLKNQKEDLINF